jgi:CRP-like cAMP-binding protein
MRLSSFPAGAVILAQGVVPESLLIIESGVVSVDIDRPEGFCELGRMGPGEVLGESGIIDQSASVARFTARTDCLVYLIDVVDLEPWLDEHPELRGTLAGLARFRAQARAAMLLQHKPVAIVPGGFLHWLRKSVNRAQPPSK